MKISWSWLLVFLVLLGCKHYNLPRGFPDVDKMADILYEIQIAENTVAQLPSHLNSQQHDAPGYYKFVLEKYNYSPAEFDSIRKWYAYHPELYVKVYDKVLIRLSKEQAVLKAKTEREKELEKEKRLTLERERELRNLWKDSTFIVVSPADTIDKRLPFVLDVDTLRLEGSLQLSALYKFMSQDVSEAPKIILSVVYDTIYSDSVSQHIPHSFSEKGVSLQLDLRDSIHPLRLEGFLLYQDSTIQSDVQIKNIYLENKVDSVALSDSLVVEESRLKKLRN